jgi:hypothetical protein
MIDIHTHRDHRREAAMATGNRDAAYRGWDFSRAVDEGPIWLRALSECFRIRSLIIFAVMGGVLSLFWIS